VPFVKISEPTVEMTFSVNDSPFAGKEGKFVTTRHLRDRLFKEMLKDVSLRVEETDSADSYRVCGRGEMHLSILIETMRRGGYEFQVGPPKVMYKEEDGVLKEPIEKLVVDVPEDKTGTKKITGTVSEASFEDGTGKVKVDGTYYSIANIVSVREKTATN
jgi:GTP-binding protein